MLIRLSFIDWNSLGCPDRIAQDIRTSYDVICVMESEPSGVEFAVEGDIPTDFMQMVHEGEQFGKYLSYNEVTLISLWKSKLTEDEIANCESAGMLEVKYENALLKEQIDTLALTILDLMEV